jgi:hypothetical protein
MNRFMRVKKTPQHTVQENTVPTNLLRKAINLNMLMPKRLLGCARYVASWISRMGTSTNVENAASKRTGTL